MPNWPKNIKTFEKGCKNLWWVWFKWFKIWPIQKKFWIRKRMLNFGKWQKAELDELRPRKIELEEELKQLLIPKDPNDSKDCISRNSWRCRRGWGFDFCGWFYFEMYQRFCEVQGWKLTVLDLTFGTKLWLQRNQFPQYLGLMSTEWWKYESGVASSPAGGLLQSLKEEFNTSAASVAVLPEMDEVEVNIDMNDVRKDTYCSSGPGGQSVNTTYSAVRLTHNPSGLVGNLPRWKNLRSKTLKRHWKLLRSRLYEIELARHNDAVGAQRKSMVGSGDRSDKIRTYNYPQSRVTDHRINKTVYNLARSNGLVRSVNSSLLYVLQRIWKKCRPAESKIRTENLRVTPQGPIFY